MSIVRVSHLIAIILSAAVVVSHAQHGRWPPRHRAGAAGALLSGGGATTYQGGPVNYGFQEICVPEKDATPDAYTFTRPDLPGYVCRRVWRSGY